MGRIRSHGVIMNYITEHPMSQRQSARPATRPLQSRTGTQGLISCQSPVLFQISLYYWIECKEKGVATDLPFILYLIAYVTRLAAAGIRQPKSVVHTYPMKIEGPNWACPWQCEHEPHARTINQSTLRYPCDVPDRKSVV